MDQPSIWVIMTNYVDKKQELAASQEEEAAAIAKKKRFLQLMTIKLKRKVKKNFVSWWDKSKT